MIETPDSVQPELPPTARADLPDAARRALAEAAERRRLQEAAAGATERPTEVNGPKGPEPVRYGDWEKNGITSDF
ncbi:DUF1674 domain-containing protein [Aurantimonas aggregata]|uniref:DUF1674 domain-containing protein n=1 Tax=Aurantimonas aggregata TaxID=2047720 RepID=A0A6L9MKV5_9HYPH|nr:succinate dehydrogenase assembly factor 4 [Aurantimonas aggregata]NDV88365.1 DUF1674 domain-containing protein [Aurantimonas aggregata]